MNRSALRRAAFVLYPISQLAMVAVAAVWIVRLQLPAGYLWLVGLLAVACIPVDYQLFREVRKTQQADILRERVHMLKEQEQVQTAYRERIAADMESILSLRRSVAAEVEQAARWLRERRDDEAQERLACAVDMMGRSAYRLCAHRSVDAVASMKMKACEEAGVHAHFALEVPESVGIPAVELCAVVANLADNALAAALRAREERSQDAGKGPRPESATAGEGAVLEAGASAASPAAPATDSALEPPAPEEPFVSLCSRVRRGHLIIEARNSMSEADCRAWERGTLRRMLARRRSWSEQHGWGLSIVAGIASRHHGELKCSAEDGVFCSTVLMRLPADVPSPVLPADARGASGSAEAEGVR